MEHLNNLWRTGNIPAHKKLLLNVLDVFIPDIYFASSVKDFEQNKSRIVPPINLPIKLVPVKINLYYEHVWISFDNNIHLERTGNDFFFFTDLGGSMQIEDIHSPRNGCLTPEQRKDLTARMDRQNRVKLFYPEGWYHPESDVFQLGRYSFEGPEMPEHNPRSYSFIASLAGQGRLENAKC